MKQALHMKQTLRKWISVLLTILILFSVATPTVFAEGNGTNGTASLSDTTMTESGSITVSFSETATATSYYNVQIADSSWSTTYVNTNITSGNSYTIADYSAGTYQIYIGYWENGSWVSDALSTTTFTVTEDDSGSTNGSAELSSTSMTLSGSIEVTFSGTASSSEYYEIQVKSTDYSTTYLDKWVTSGNSYTITADSADNSPQITAAGDYYIYIGYWKDSTWKSTAYEGTITVTSDDSGSGGSTDTYAVSITPLCHHL
ncbi:MAG: hypothetical protein LUC83_08770 [Clostridiales bacterium]|nr:hypothetical protein [Clostridiales bacterium]